MTSFTRRSDFLIMNHATAEIHSHCKLRHYHIFCENGGACGRNVIFGETIGRCTLSPPSTVHLSVEMEKLRNLFAIVSNPEITITFLPIYTRLTSPKLGSLKNGTLFPTKYPQNLPQNLLNCFPALVFSCQHTQSDS